MYCFPGGFAVDAVSEDVGVSVGSVVGFEVEVGRVGNTETTGLLARLEAKCNKLVWIRSACVVEVTSVLGTVGVDVDIGVGNVDGEQLDVYAGNFVADIGVSGVSNAIEFETTRLLTRFETKGNGLVLLRSAYAVVSEDE